MCRRRGAGGREQWRIFCTFQKGQLSGEAGSRIDAIFGTGMEEGVREYQRQAGIGVDGIAGPQTFEKLLG